MQVRFHLVSMSIFWLLIIVWVGIFLASNWIVANCFYKSLATSSCICQQMISLS